MLINNVFLLTDIRSTVAALMLQDLLKEKAADLLLFKVCIL